MLAILLDGTKPVSGHDKPVHPVTVLKPLHPVTVLKQEQTDCTRYSEVCDSHSEFTELR